MRPAPVRAVEELAWRKSDWPEFFWRAVIFISVALVPVLIWFLFDVILIVVGAIVIAVLLRLVAEPFIRWGKLPEPIALILSGSFIILVVAVGGYLFGSQIESEFTDVLQRASDATAQIMKQLQGSQSGKLVLRHIEGGSGVSLPSVLGNVFSVSVRFLEALVVTVIGGFYLAAQPQLYRNGLAKLFPRRMRKEVDETLDDIGLALRLWLIADLMQMVIIGALTTGAVWLIGLPSPLALGVIAGLAEFVPYLGPIVAAVPAILVATTQGMDAVIWTVIAYLVIHQIEGNLVAPLIQRQLVFIPPAVMLLGIVTVLFVFGGFSVIFAGPIAVVIFVAVNKLYVRDSLHEKTVLPGEQTD
jgi:predicted PurR-regulated permease PerM